MSSIWVKVNKEVKSNLDVYKSRVTLIKNLVRPVFKKSGSPSVQKSGLPSVKKKPARPGLKNLTNVSVITIS